MHVYRKVFNDSNLSYVKNEITLYKKAAKFILCPPILDTDYQTYMDCVHLNEMNIGDRWGNNIEDIPTDVLQDMFNIVWKLYHICRIEYIDVWPRNFIKTDNRVWVIDLGDAKPRNFIRDPYLKHIFKAGRITHWNPEFI